MAGARDGDRGIADHAGPGEDPARDLAAALRHYLDHLVVERGRAANTVEAYRRDLTRYVEHLSAVGRRAPGDVTADDLSGFVAALRAGDGDRPPLAATSVARALAAAKGWHRYWSGEGWAGDVAAAQPSLRAAERLPRALSVEDVARLLEAPDRESFTGMRDAALMELLYATGARISEAVDLDLPDVRDALRAGDQDPPFVLVTGKGGKQRYVPVGSQARHALDAYAVRARPALVARRKGRPPAREPLFVNSRGERLTRQNGFAILDRAARRSGVPAAVSPHVLRHSFATHLLAGGADIRVVQELLGHASLATTQVYTRVTVDTLREVYAASHPRARSA